VTRHVGRTGAAATKWRLEFSDARISALFACEIKRRRLGTRFANWVFAGTPNYGDQQLRAESAAALHEKGDFDEDCDSLYLGLAHGRSLGGAGDSLSAGRRSLVARSAKRIAVCKPRLEWTKGDGADWILAAAELRPCVGRLTIAVVRESRPCSTETLKLQENLLKKKPPEEAANDHQRFEAKV
jgi:hypothetical protein